MENFFVPFWTHFSACNVISIYSPMLCTGSYVSFSLTNFWILYFSAVKVWALHFPQIWRRLMGSALSSRVYTLHIKAPCSFKTWGTNYLVTQQHTQGKWSPQSHCCVNFRNVKVQFHFKDKKSCTITVGISQLSSHEIIHTMHSIPHNSACPCC
jgi:hypothetical protein